MPLLEAHGLVKRYGSLLAVDDLSFSVAAGEVLALLGPNGSGKTTVLRAVGATLRLDAGRVLVAGRDVAKDPRGAKARLGVLHQEDTLDPDLSVIENLLVHARYLEIPRAPAHARAKELLARFGLASYSEARIAQLSGGLCRRLGLARAFFRAEALVLDEPTTGLDPEAKLALWGDLRELLRDGAAILLSTHDMEEAERLADRVLLLDRGRRRAEGSPRDLIRAETSGHVHEIRLPVPRLGEAAELAGRLSATLAAKDAATRLARHGGFLFCETHAEEVLRAWAEAENLPLTLRHATLGDVYLRVTGRGLVE